MSQATYSSTGTQWTIFSVGCAFLLQGIIVGIIQCAIARKRQPFAIKLNGMFVFTGAAYFLWLFVDDYV